MTAHRPEIDWEALGVFIVLLLGTWAALYSIFAAFGWDMMP